MEEAISTPPPPSFDKLEYWDTRYSQTSQSYDWLNTHEVLDEQIDAALSLAHTDTPRILHIGCGNSELSFHLRLKVANPEQIQNVDYSSVAIAWGRSREKAMFNPTGWEATDDDHSPAVPSQAQFQMPMMQWNTLDLLDIGALISTCALSSYSMIIDKGTSDSLACTSSTQVSLPYFLYTDADSGGDTTLDVLRTKPAHVSTLQILSCHLALLARPRARWIVFSYSSTRFAFLDTAYGEDEDVARVLKMEGSVPQPRVLWKMVWRQAVEKPYACEDERVENSHFIYVLERTDEALKVRTV